MASPEGGTHGTGLVTPAPARPAVHPRQFQLILATAIACVLLAIVLLSGVARRRAAIARRSALLSDLGRLSEAQDDALARDGRYATHLERTGGTDTARFTPSPDVKVRFEVLGAGSWNAVVTDTVLAAGPRSCGIFRGEASASPHRAVVRPGVPACW